MDETLVASILKSLETKPTAEIRQAYESGAKTSRPTEELEAMRQILEERRAKVNKASIAVASAILMGLLGAVCTWWQGGDDALVLLAGASFAILGFASWYVPGLISGT